MIQDYAKLKVGPMTVEVNWNEASKPCKKIRFGFLTSEGDKVEALVSREELYALLMLFGDEQQQEDLVPVNMLNVRAVTRLLKVRAKTDLRKGDIITVPYTYYMPVGTAEKLVFHNRDKYKLADETKMHLTTKK